MQIQRVLGLYVALEKLPEKRVDTEVKAVFGMAPSVGTAIQICHERYTEAVTGVKRVRCIKADSLFPGSHGIQVTKAA